MQPAASAEGSAGTSGLIFANNHVTNLDTVIEQMCQENASDIVWNGNSITVSGDLWGAPQIFGGTSCYGLTFTNNRITVGNTAVYGVFAFASPVIATVVGNTIRIDKLSVNQGGIGEPVVGNSVTTYDLRSLLKVWGNTWQIGHNLAREPLTWGTQRAQVIGRSGWFTQ
jgi:hypothetical protein